MTKLKFNNIFNHLKEEFYPSTDLGYYEIYKPETLFFYN